MLEQEDVTGNKETNDERVTINLVQEEIRVHKEVIEKDTVRIIKKVHATQETVNTSVQTEEVQVEKIAVNKYVDSYPEVRYEGNTMIVPVVKEVVVVEKKLLLIEEVYITRHTVTSQEEQTLPLRREEIIVERLNTNNTKI